MIFKKRNGFKKMKPNNPSKIAGKMIQGAQKAAFFTELDWVKLQCREKLGFVPFPGTLNLEITPPGIQCLENMSDKKWEELVPPDQTFCSSKVLPVSIGHIKGALILPGSDVNIHGNHVIEILAPVKLRDALGLADGDMVTVIMGEPMAFQPQKLCVDAVLFDLDGTLIDSIESYYRIVEIALAKMKLPKVPRQTILAAAKNDEFNWEMILPDLPGRSREEIIKEAWQIIEKNYPEMFLKNVTPFPDIEPVLRLLHAHDIRIGIVTSTPEKNIHDKLKILDRPGLLDLIDVVISAGDGERKKPFPDPLIRCRQRMGLQSDQCVYVGDMGIDIAAGRAAGMKTIGVLTGFETRQDLLTKNPDAIINSISDLPELLGL